MSAISVAPEILRAFESIVKLFRIKDKNLMRNTIVSEYKDFRFDDKFREYIYFNDGTLRMCYIMWSMLRLRYTSITKRDENLIENTIVKSDKGTAKSEEFIKKYSSVVQNIVTKSDYKPFSYVDMSEFNVIRNSVLDDEDAPCNVAPHPDEEPDEKKDAEPDEKKDEEPDLDNIVHGVDSKDSLVMELTSTSQDLDNFIISQDYSGVLESRAQILEILNKLKYLGLSNADQVKTYISPDRFKKIQDIMNRASKFLSDAKVDEADISSRSSSDFLAKRPNVSIDPARYALLSEEEKQKFDAKKKEIDDYNKSVDDLGKTVMKEDKINQMKDRLIRLGVKNPQIIDEIIKLQLRQIMMGDAKNEMTLLLQRAGIKEGSQIEKIIKSTALANMFGESKMHTDDPHDVLHEVKKQIAGVLPDEKKKEFMPYMNVTESKPRIERDLKYDQEIMKRAELAYKASQKIKKSNALFIERKIKSVKNNKEDVGLDSLFNEVQLEQIGKKSTDMLIRDPDRTVVRDIERYGISYICG